MKIKNTPLYFRSLKLIMVIFFISLLLIQTVIVTSTRQDIKDTDLDNIPNELDDDDTPGITQPPSFVGEDEMSEESESED